MTGLFLLLTACRPTLSERDITVTVSDAVSTVVTASWRTDGDTRGWVEYGPDEGYGQQTPTTASGTDHSVQLLGLRADTTYHLRVVTDDGYTSDDLTVTTGALPNALPTLLVEGEPGAWSGFTPLAVIGVTNAAIIVDSAGEIVWYWLHPADEEGFESTGGRRVALAPSGDGVFVNQIGSQGQARLHRVSWDGSEVVTLSVPDHNHDFVPMPDDGAVALFYDRTQQDDGSRLIGDKVSRVAPDGTITDLWSANAHLSPQADPPNSGSWVHANALDVADDGETFYMGMRNLSSIARLTDGGTQLDWILGDPRYGFSDFSFADGAEPFNGQHQFEFLSEDRLLVFDNNPSGTSSRVVEYQLYLDSMVAEQVWEHDIGKAVYALGEAARLPDEATFLNLSTLGVLLVIDSSGQRQWRASLSLGYALGYGVPVDTLYSE